MAARQTREDRTTALRCSRSGAPPPDRSLAWCALTMSAGAPAFRSRRDRASGLTAGPAECRRPLPGRPAPRTGPSPSPAAIRPPLPGPQGKQSNRRRHGTGSVGPVRLHRVRSLGLQADDGREVAVGPGRIDPAHRQRPRRAAGGGQMSRACAAASVCSARVCAAGSRRTLSMSCPSIPLVMRWCCSVTSLFRDPARSGTLPNVAGERRGFAPAGSARGRGRWFSGWRHASPATVRQSPRPSPAGRARRPRDARGSLRP